MRGVYIHIPFCVKKCHYCDFYSEEFIKTRYSTNKINFTNNPRALTKFSDFLCKEIELQRLELGESSSISTIFFGGGTPSLLSSRHIEQILHCIKSNFLVIDDAEITLEANPGTITLDKLKKYRQLGINRLSFGVQSFIQKELDFLQRIHSPDEAVKAVNNARLAGFDNINIDLMFSVPGQTKESINYSIDTALKLNPEHFSSYSLIYEPDTPLYEDLKKGLVRKLSDKKDADFYLHTIKRFEDAGYLHYEVSNYAKNDSLKCKHNLNYWNGSEYLAFGPSAHGFISGKRFWNYRNIGKYYEYISSGILPIEDSEILTDHDKLVEFIFLGLRAEGIYLTQLANYFGEDKKDKLEKAIKDYVTSNHISFKDDLIKVTKKGFTVCDELILKILNVLD